MIKAYDPGQAAQTYQTITQILHTANIEPQPFSGIRNTSNDANTQLNMTGLLLIVQLLSLLALVLISVMIFSIISALISEQIKIIGTMKALGRTRWPIFKSYLLTVSVYGSSGTLLGVGIGLFLGYQLAINLSKTVQIQVGNFMFPIDVGAVPGCSLGSNCERLCWDRSTAAGRILAALDGHTYYCASGIGGLWHPAYNQKTGWLGTATAVGAANCLAGLTRSLLQADPDFFDSLLSIVM